MFLNDGYLLLESLERYSGVKGNFVPACMGVTQLSSRREGELEACNALSRRGDRWFRELSQLAAIDKGFENILADAEVINTPSRAGGLNGNCQRRL
jgi:hypothetical protein